MVLSQIDSRNTTLRVTNGHLFSFSTGQGIYETVSMRTVLDQANALHLNRLKGWKWASDVFAYILMVLSLTGLFVLRGKYGRPGEANGWLPLGYYRPCWHCSFSSARTNRPRKRPETTHPIKTDWGTTCPLRKTQSILKISSGLTLLHLFG